MKATDFEVMQSFARVCDDGWQQGWHERNGGNLTYRMTAEEVDQLRPFFRAVPGKWVQMDVQADNLRGEYFIATGSGKYFRHVQRAMQDTCCIVEINAAGDAWRIVWGLEKGGRPTSEFPSHFLNHSVRKAATGGACRVIYHAHPGQCNRHDLHPAPDGARFHPRALAKRHRVPCGFPRRRGRGALDGARRARYRPGHQQADARV